MRRCACWPAARRATQHRAHAHGGKTHAGQPHVDANFLDRQYRVNTRSPYLLTQKLLPSLIARQGQVVFVNSSAGHHPAKSGWVAYSASKHALRAVTLLDPDIAHAGAGEALVEFAQSVKEGKAKDSGPDLAWRAQPVEQRVGPVWVGHCRPRMSAIRSFNLGAGFPAVRSGARPAQADPVIILSCGDVTRCRWPLGTGGQPQQAPGLPASPCRRCCWIGGHGTLPYEQ